MKFFPLLFALLLPACSSTPPAQAMSKGQTCPACPVCPNPNPTVTVTPQPSPTPSVTPRPSPTPTPSPSPSPSPTPVPSVTPTPTPTPTPSVTPTPPSSKLTGVWANEGGEKIPQEDLPKTTGKNVVNSVWDGTTVKLTAAKNEVAGFELLLESMSGVSNVTVNFSALVGPGGTIANTSTDPLNYVGRPIEQFVLGYLPIKGMSRLSYDTYDERHIPVKLQRPWTGAGIGSGTWISRQDHDKNYPDIAIPASVKGAFAIPAAKSQAVWFDVYVPKNASGVYSGTIQVLEAGTVTKNIPITLSVYGFTLPDMPSSKTMVYYEYGDMNERVAGSKWPDAGTADATTVTTVRDHFFKLMHRHKLSVIDRNEGPEAWSAEAPRAHWLGKLNGSFFTAANGYDGPGVGTGNNVFSVATYGSWSWKAGVTQATMQQHSGAWENWFKANAPSTERFLYLIDESPDYASIQNWSLWTKGQLKSFATIPLAHAAADTPALDISASWIDVAPTSWSQSAAARKAAGNQYWFYNGKRPASGSFATEDDGVALRELAWGQYKLGISRWFFWNTNYYNDYQGGRGQTDVFKNAHTFGGPPTQDATLGETGWNHSNGDGLLVYPGTDKKFPASSLGFAGPIASLRMKLWRRGIQDVDYITLAAAKDPVAAQAIVNRMVPKVMWENGVSDASDPTWVRTDIGWSVKPDDWEKARADLAAIILK